MVLRCACLVHTRARLSLNRPMIRKERRPIHILASFRLTVRRGFVLVKAKPYFSSLLHLPCIQFLRKVFFNVFSCSKQNNENVLQNSKSIVVMTHDGNWQNANHFRLFILLLYSFFEKFFPTSFLAQSRIKKTLCKTASLS